MVRCVIAFPICAPSSMILLQQIPSVLELRFMAPRTFSLPELCGLLDATLFPLWQTKWFIKRI